MIPAMRWTIFAALLLLAACHSASEKAQSDVDFLVAHNGSEQDLCDAYTKLADAYRDEKRATEWDHAKLYQRIHCRAAATG
jgi:ABC-type glycerol-3-phosphate transport system substrate-binding protein